LRSDALICLRPLFGEQPFKRGNALRVTTARRAPPDAMTFAIAADSASRMARTSTNQGPLASNLHKRPVQLTVPGLAYGVGDGVVVVE
jgi:hypothetical protein